jgi:hypothetical protein
MKLNHHWTAIAVTVGALALAGCSSDETLPETAPATSEAAPAPVESAAPAPTPISKEQAGAQYLELVAPVNQLNGPWNDALAASDWAALRQQAQPYADALRAFADGLMAAEWPPEAQPSVDALVGELAAEITAFVQIAGTTTDAETVGAVNAFPAPGSSAQQLRMILGLENVPTG